MSGCDPGPKLAAARRGYADACLVDPAALEAFDMTLEPFDILTEATLTYPAPATVWTDVAVYQMPPGSYGILRFIGQDVNDPVAFQLVQWRVLRNQRVMGGDRNGLIPALEARCGIIDGTLMPFRFFIQPGGYVQLQAALVGLPSGAVEGTAVVRGRLQGERRDSYGVSA